MASNEVPLTVPPVVSAETTPMGTTPPIAPPATTSAASDIMEAEADDYEDHDSAFDGSVASSTTSIGSSILKYREENGRRYHAYKEGKYVLPNDEIENDRLDLQHQLLYLTQEGKLFLAPIPKEKALHNVLDAGTGTGIWAIDFADEHPESQVLGIDLSPIQPNFLPPNCRFEVDDLEESWTYRHKFDFIYSRMMCGSLADWPRFFSQAYDNLAPGGYLELCDGVFPVFADDDSFPPDSALKKWGNLILTAASNLGRSADSALLYKEQMEAAGFVNVVQKIYKWPTNGWPKDKKMKELGVWNYANMGESTSGLSLALFTRGLGWSMEELEVFLIDVKKEMKSTKIHAYWNIYVVYGQKPE